MEAILQQYESQFTGYSSQILFFIHKYKHTLPIPTAVAYLLMVFFLPKILQQGSNGKNSKPSAFLKVLMATWNLFLSALSILMVLGFGIPFAYAISERGLMGSICDTTHDLFKSSSMVFWAHIFVLSKYIELIDTVFLIVKNPERPVPFLHYYHHASVLLFSWYADVNNYTVGMWSIVVNGCVHTIMYFYYFLTELGYRPRWAVLITITQITQMIIGVVMNSVWAYKFYNGSNCQCDSPNATMVAALVMYGSYLYLFMKFFVKRYFGGSAKPKQH